jgi:capsular polysaccharide biosynthesis protein/tetratricopeptide (TPR) repeat protein
MPDPLLTSALGEFKAGRLEAARAACEASLATSPAEAKAYRLLGLIESSRNRPADAADFLLRAAALAPSRSQTHRELGRVLQGAARFEAAAAAFGHAADLDPFDARSRTIQGELLGRVGQWPQAADALARGITGDPTQWEAFYNLGLILAELGHRRSAATAMTAAICLDPECGKAWQGLGLMQRQRRLWDQALGPFAHALVWMPASAKTRYHLGHCLLESGRPERAIGALSAALALKPGMTNGHLRMSQALLACDREGEAAVSFGRAQALTDGRSLPVRAYARSTVEAYCHRHALPFRQWSPARMISIATTARHWPHLTYDVPPRFLACVEGARIHTANGVTITDTGYALMDGLTIGSVSEANPGAYLPAESGRIVLAAVHEGLDRVDDEAIFFGGGANYFHGVVDWASRLRQIVEAPELAGLPFLVVESTPPQVMALLELLGFGGHRRVSVPAARFIAVRRAWLPSLTQSRLGFVDPAHLAWLRERVLPQIRHSGAPRRLYVARGDTRHRRIANEEELAIALARHGFEAVRPAALPLSEQLALFAAAEIVVGAFGAGLTNIVFAPAGARVVELTHEAALHPMFALIAAHLGQGYAQVLGTPAGLSGRSPMHADFTVDPATVIAAVQAEA